jgi:hypothetical protein
MHRNMNPSIRITEKKSVCCASKRKIAKVLCANFITKVLPSRTNAVCECYTRISEKEFLYMYRYYYLVGTGKWAYHAAIG